MNLRSKISIIVVVVFDIGYCLIASFGIAGYYVQQDACANTGCIEEVLWLHGQNISMAHVQMQLINLNTGKTDDGDYYDTRNCESVPNAFPCYMYYIVYWNEPDRKYLQPNRGLELGWIAFLLIPIAALLILYAAITDCFQHNNCCYCKCCKETKTCKNITAIILLVVSGIFIALFVGVMISGILGIFDSTTETCLLNCDEKLVPTESGMVNATNRTITFNYITDRYSLKTLQYHWFDYTNAACELTSTCYRYYDEIKPDPIRVNWYLFMLVPIGLMAIPIAIGSCLCSDLKTTPE
jgi:hypothetical protein